MIKPTDKDIGRAVTFRYRTTAEEGVLTSVNEHYAFVMYGGRTSSATRFEDLEWSEPGASDACAA